MNDPVTPIKPEPTFEPWQINPLIDTGVAGSTAHNVSCVLEYPQSLNHDTGVCHADCDNWVFGRHLMYDVLIRALRYDAGTLGIQTEGVQP